MMGFAFQRFMFATSLSTFSASITQTKFREENVLIWNIKYHLSLLFWDIPLILVPLQEPNYQTLKHNVLFGTSLLTFMVIIKFKTS